MDSFWSKININLKAFLANFLSVLFAILIIAAVPVVITILYTLLSRKKTIQLYPELKIVDIKNEVDVDTAVAKEGIKIAKQILTKIKSMKK